MQHGGMEFRNLVLLLLLLILALKNIKQRKILGNVDELVGRVDVNRVAKSIRFYRSVYFASSFRG